MRNSIIIAAAAALIALPATASASTVEAKDFSVSVKHRDLDLSTSEGASRLDERVRTRIRQMCQTGGRDSDSRRLESECRESALAATMPQIDLAIAEARAERRLAASTVTPSTAERAATPGA
ncbi:MAG: UrcA family protein [Erythrobacter sp.]